MCPFPMNCLCSTCRLTLIPGGWSVNLPFSRYARVARETPAIVKKGNWVSNFPQPDVSGVGPEL
jgi:hypothetical protein